MGMVGKRVGWSAVLGLLLLISPAAHANAAPAVATQSEDPPDSTPPMGAQLSARPGERLSFAMPSYLPGLNGDWVVSEIFVEHGTLRMNDPVITAAAIVRCDTRPGVYPVETAGPDSRAGGAKGNVWVTVEVADIDEAERKACPAKVAALPLEQPEEHWPAGESWPQSPWDVRTFKPGDKVTLTGSDADLRFGDTLTSPGFTSRAVMHGAKGMSAAAAIRCDAKPGLYEVHWVGGGEVWARYRVVQIDDATRRSCQDQAAETAMDPWLLGGGAAGAAVAALVVGLVLRRRRHAAAVTPPVQSG